MSRAARAVAGATSTAGAVVPGCDHPVRCLRGAGLVLAGVGPAEAVARLLVVWRERAKCAGLVTEMNNLKVTGCKRPAAKP